MNEDDLYQEISVKDYIKLKNIIGYFKVISDNLDFIVYFKNYENYEYGYIKDCVYYCRVTQHLMYEYDFIPFHMLHRLDGPAWTSRNINNECEYMYYIHNIKYIKEKFNQHPEVIQYRLQKFQKLIKLS